MQPVNVPRNLIKIPSHTDACAPNFLRVSYRQDSRNAGGSDGGSKEGTRFFSKSSLIVASLHKQSSLLNYTCDCS